MTESRQIWDFKSGVPRASWYSYSRKGPTAIYVQPRSQGSFLGENPGNEVDMFAHFLVLMPRMETDCNWKKMDNTGG